MQDIDLLIDAYIDSSIDDDQFEVLCAWLREDAEHRQTFARKLALHSEIAEWCIERSGGRLTGHLDTAEAEAELPTIQYTASDQLTKQKYMSALSYVLRHTFTPKRVVMLATAAALLLGVVLAIVLLSGPNDSERIVDVPDEPAPIVQVPDARRVVASLTAERDAIWDRRPGEDLYAGQRFTLTQGFAEITTKRGAVTILEAPATIELLENDNALQLHSGKLVGICETESSKGLLVRTPHMDITDLGTRFGVDVSSDSTQDVSSDSTQVGVLEGSVRVDPPEDQITFAPIVAEAGEALVLSDDNALPQTLAVQPEHFQWSLPEPYEAMILGAKPALYYRFDELTDQGQLTCSGTDHTPIVGARQADLGPGPTLGGVPGSGLSLTNSRQYIIQTTTPIDLDYASGMTVEAWVWVPPESDPRMRVVSNGQAMAGQDPLRGFGFGIMGRAEPHSLLDGGHLLFTGFGDVSFASIESVPTGRWTHIAATVDAQSTVSLMIDGQAAAHRRLDTKADQKAAGNQERLRIRPSAAPLRIGASPREANWVGGIDELAIYDRALSQKELARRVQWMNHHPQ